MDSIGLFSIVIMQSGPMKILEFQSKNLCREFGIPVPDSMLLTSIHAIKNKCVDLNFPIVMKAQVPLHKRAHRGGICLARTWGEAVSLLSSMFIRKVGDHQVDRILVEEMIEFHTGLSVSLKYDEIDFSIVLSVSESLPSLEENGVKSDPSDNELLYKIDPYLGILDSTIAEISALLMLETGYWNNFKSILTKLWGLFINLELRYLEVNPLVVGADSRFFVLGIDIDFDDYALFRHPEINRFVESGSAEELEHTLRKLDYGYTRYDGKCCVVSTSMQACAAIREILISAGQEASELISSGGFLTAESLTQLLQLVEKENRAECILLHVVGDSDDNKIVIEGCRTYLSSSQSNIPIIARINGLELIHKQDQDKSNQLFLINTLAEIPDIFESLTKGEI
jgi:succinyl-CoA synthetase beta subunit